MARFEDFTQQEQRVILEAMAWSQSEFFDPGHTKEDRDTLRDLIREAGFVAHATISADKPLLDVTIPAPPVKMEHVCFELEVGAEKAQEPAQGVQQATTERREAHTPAKPPRPFSGPAEAAAGGRPQKAPEATPKGHTGFLLIKCDHCGDVHAFCAKQPVRDYRCAKCGGRTPLTDMHRLRVTCECGGRYNYITNIVTRQMDVNCFKCGAPVAVEWSERRGRYEPIEWEEARKGGRRK